MKTPLLLLLLINASSAFAQMPNTDIFLLDLKQSKSSIVNGKPVNITHRDGYDNQPAFLSDNQTILYTSIRDGRVDTYSYSLKDSSTKQVTATEESEYSPTEMPDKKHFSTVQVEKDSSQRLWKFPIGGGVPELIANFDSVGYHCWIDANNLALFVLTNPFTLQMLNIPTGQHSIVAKNIGRCILRIPGKNAISYVEKVSEKEWLIKEMNLADRSVNTIIKTPEGREDFVWTADGTLLMGNNGKLMKFNPKQDKDWKEASDLSASVKDFMRIAISKDGKHLCVVSKGL